MRKNNKMRMMILMVVLTGMLILTGCNKYANMENDMKNVEERDYATILLVMEGKNEKNYHFILGIAQEKKVGEKSMTEEVSEWDCDDLKELAKAYSSVKGKDLSLAHLKVILFSIDEKTKKAAKANNGTEKENMQSLLGMLDENEEIAKTCPALQLSESEAFLAYMKQEDKPVGSYFENLIREMGRQGQKVTWLKDYLKAMREQMPMERFVLRRVNEGWTIDKEEGQCYINSSTGQ